MDLFLILIGNIIGLIVIFEMLVNYTSTRAKIVLCGMFLVICFCFITLMNQNYQTEVEEEITNVCTISARKIVFAEPMKIIKTRTYKPYCVIFDKTEYKVMRINNEIE